MDLAELGVAAHVPGEVLLHQHPGTAMMIFDMKTQTRRPMGLASDSCGASGSIRYEIRVNVEIRVVRQISRGYLLFAVIMLLAQQGCRDSRAVRGSGEQPSTTYRGPSGGYGEYHAMPGNAKISWDSPKMRAIEKEYAIRGRLCQKFRTDSGRRPWGQEHKRGQDGSQSSQKATIRQRIASIGRGVRQVAC